MVCARLVEAAPEGPTNKTREIQHSLVGPPGRGSCMYLPTVPFETRSFEIRFCTPRLPLRRATPVLYTVLSRACRRLLRLDRFSHKKH